MKNRDLPFDRSCHVLCSKACRKQMEREAVWERVQKQHAGFLSDWRTDLGGSKNFHNGAGGTYDCIAIMSYYTVCRVAAGYRRNR